MNTIQTMVALSISTRLTLRAHAQFIEMIDLNECAWSW